MMYLLKLVCNRHHSFDCTYSFGLCTCSDNQHSISILSWSSSWSLWIHNCVGVGSSCVVFTSYRKMKMSTLFVCFLMILGCGSTTSADATERGLSYVATAIVVSAVIRAFFNK